MRAGKGLNERLTEVPSTFKRQACNPLVPSEPNQLVLRIQPDEGICFKCIIKAPRMEADRHRAGADGHELRPCLSRELQCRCLRANTPQHVRR